MQGGPQSLFMLSMRGVLASPFGIMVKHEVDPPIAQVANTCGIKITAQSALQYFCVMRQSLRNGCFSDGATYKSKTAQLQSFSHFQAGLHAATSGPTFHCMHSRHGHRNKYCHSLCMVPRSCMVMSSVCMPLHAQINQLSTNALFPVLPRTGQHLQQHVELLLVRASLSLTSRPAFHIRVPHTVK